MTILSLNPAALPLFYPRATPAVPQKLRIIAQVFDFNYSSALLSIRRVPNLEPLHTEIDLDDVGSSEEEITLVDISNAVRSSSARDFYPGTIVSIIGFYNGSIINAVECYTSDEQALLGDSIKTLATIATLENL